MADKNDDKDRGARREAHDAVQRMYTQRAAAQFVRGHPDNPMQTGIMQQPLAANGLAFRRFVCANCGRYFHDEAVLLGVIRIRCHNCKEPNLREFNRLEEDKEIHEYVLGHVPTVEVLASELDILRYFAQQLPLHPDRIKDAMAALIEFVSRLPA